MKRAYLEEDLELIRKYFPGARVASIRTPFDLTHHAKLPRLAADSFHDDTPEGWKGKVLWIQ